MPNRPLALVERAQAAINNIATQSMLYKGDAGIRCADQPLRISATHEIHRMGLRGRLGETATERQPEHCQKPERRKDLVSFDAKSLIHMVRLAGIEPTTPWFVAKYSIQLSYSRSARILAWASSWSVSCDALGISHKPLLTVVC